MVRIFARILRIDHHEPARIGSGGRKKEKRVPDAQRYDAERQSDRERKNGGNTQLPVLSKYPDRPKNVQHIRATLIDDPDRHLQTVSHKANSLKKGCCRRLSNLKSVR